MTAIPNLAYDLGMRQVPNYNISYKIFSGLLTREPLSVRRKKAIESAKTATEEPFRFHVLRLDGTLEVYFGTSANKQGYSVSSYKPAVEAKRHEPYYSINFE